jgi:hypothetical protein
MRNLRLIFTALFLLSGCAVINPGQLEKHIEIMNALEACPQTLPIDIKEISTPIQNLNAEVIDTRKETLERVYVCTHGARQYIWPDYESEENE